MLVLFMENYEHPVRWMNEGDEHDVDHDDDDIANDDDDIGEPDELSHIWLYDSDWAGGKELGAVRVTMDVGVHMGVPGWPHELLDLKKVAQHDPKVTEKCEK